VQIRPSQESDRGAISRLHVSAFGPAQGPAIAALVEELFDDPTAEPILSLVAVSDTMLVGHILFTAVTIPSKPQRSMQILAPLAVANEYQGAGVGGLLITEGLQQLAGSGVELVFVLGHPGYYSRYGFQPAGVQGFTAPYPIAPEHADAWMVHELVAGALSGNEGRIQCAEALNQPQHWQE
jgi:predicted N-acetyltransferase YhbS